jgi:hypothetical protein
MNLYYISWLYNYIQRLKPMNFLWFLVVFYINWLVHKNSNKTIFLTCMYVASCDQHCTMHNRSNMHCTPASCLVSSSSSTPNTQQLEFAAPSTTCPCSSSSSRRRPRSTATCTRRTIDYAHCSLSLSP